MITSSLCFSDLYREIDLAVFNSPEKEQGTGPGDTEMWLEEYGALLSDFDKSLKKLAPSLEVQSVEVARNDEAVFFCANQSLIGYLWLIESLIKKHFPTVQKISFSLDYDPETSDKWVNADIEITGDVSRVIEWEDAFITEWVSEVPYPERDKIRLSCDIM